MMFLLTYGHLRHSHMWIAFTGLAGRILQSPAHHQIHHSTNPAHFDKNLGFALAVWDWAFGTLAIPARTREPIVFGVGDEGAPFRSTLSALVAPCARLPGHALSLVRGAGARDAAGGAKATSLTICGQQRLATVASSVGDHGPRRLELRASHRFSRATVTPFPCARETSLILPPDPNR